MWTLNHEAFCFQITTIKHNLSTKNGVLTMKKTVSTNSAVSTSGLGKAFQLLAVFFSLALFVVEPAFAQGGLEKVNTFVDNVLVILRACSIGVVTIAIMWAGYLFLFKRADMADCGKILVGGLLIGGAAELASYLLN